ncbi:toprim domain-containing protein [Autumnicola edwardsiae]|jgi:5S rRNA maturation endonuclease (ribonuclease M5)|uniref:Toprim domain-containing protein n=1 Tax=Autumnicola edwardsiae TaxID=3075594 RepID=A0ABU3CY69_9FLAO|nr:toprim domain-containing protein [Zunongwangia sp. F297]MDT0651318.1 toprim domain-containing protein [Zunongwangia sp. F297]
MMKWEWGIGWHLIQKIEKSIMKTERTVAMSCESARNLCIVKTLAKLGHFPSKTTEKEAWFLSPLRSETQASFNVSLMKNLWYDFGIGKGGSVIDLIMEMKSCSVKEAMEFLKADTIIPCFHVPKPQLHSENKIEVIGIGTLKHFALKGYLRSRNIPLEIARLYCKEIWYRLNNREYFAIGLENSLGGWELRNKYYKNSSSPKSYSFIDHSSDRLLVTEGIFDFLSLAVLNEELVMASDVMVLNSLSFLKDIEELIPYYREVLLFLDHDAAGEKATQELLNLYDNVTDSSALYNGYVDLNDKLKDEKCQTEK